MDFLRNKKNLSKEKDRRTQNDMRITREKCLVLNAKTQYCKNIKKKNFFKERKNIEIQIIKMKRKKYSHKFNTRTIYPSGLSPSSAFSHVYFYRNVKLFVLFPVFSMSCT